MYNDFKKSYTCDILIFGQANTSCYHCIMIVLFVGETYEIERDGRS